MTRMARPTMTKKKEKLRNTTVTMRPRTIRKKVCTSKLRPRKAASPLRLPALPAFIRATNNPRLLSRPTSLHSPLALPPLACPLPRDLPPLAWPPLPPPVPQPLQVEVMACRLRYPAPLLLLDTVLLHPRVLRHLTTNHLHLVVADPPHPQALQPHQGVAMAALQLQHHLRHLEHHHHHPHLEHHHHPPHPEHHHHQLAVVVAFLVPFKRERTYGKPPHPAHRSPHPEGI